MPIYEYECARCHSHFDRRQGFDEAPITACPECKGKASRVIQAVSVVYKGSGWYVTDYARKSVVGANGTKSSESPADTKGTEKPGEKPAEKPREAVASGGKSDAPKSETKVSPKVASKASSSESKGA